MTDTVDTRRPTDWEAREIAAGRLTIEGTTEDPRLGLRIPTTTLPTMDREQYASLKRHEYVGTLRSMGEDTAAAFRASGGTHWWMYGTDRGGASLGPVKVVKS